MAARRALLLLGANIGDRASALRRALAGLDRLEGCRLLRASRLFETAPVGPSERPYLNMAAVLRTGRSAIGLLIEFKRLESEAGRRLGPRWSARPLDIDLIALGRERVRSPWLTVPHPLAAERPFALAPLVDAAPHWRLDGRRTAAALLASLKPDPRSVRLWRHGR